MNALHVWYACAAIGLRLVRASAGLSRDEALEKVSGRSPRIARPMLASRRLWRAAEAGRPPLLWLPPVITGSPADLPTLSRDADASPVSVWTPLPRARAALPTTAAMIDAAMQAMNMGEWCAAVVRDHERGWMMTLAVSGADALACLTAYTEAAGVPCEAWVYDPNHHAPARKIGPTCGPLHGVWAEVLGE